jgi:hypothetical protein
MLKFMFWLIIILTIFVAVWVLWLRPYLRDKPSAAWFFHLIEPVEIALWSKSESVLWARWLQFLGIASAGLAFAGSFDPMTLIFLVPDEWRWILLGVPPAALFLNGVIQKMLREGTTKPLELVAVPDSAPIEVKEAVVKAEITKDDAVAAVKAAA